MDEKESLMCDAMVLINSQLGVHTKILEKLSDKIVCLENNLFELNMKYTNDHTEFKEYNCEFINTDNEINDG